MPGVERIDVSVRPADLKVGADERSWLTTVSGIWGDAVGTPNGFQPDWGSQFPAGPAAAAPPPPQAPTNRRGTP